jgi:hypothetical protein
MGIRTPIFRMRTGGPNQVRRWERCSCRCLKPVFDLEGVAFYRINYRSVLFLSYSLVKVQNIQTNKNPPPASAGFQKSKLKRKILLGWGLFIGPGRGHGDWYCDELDSITTHRVLPVFLGCGGWLRSSGLWLMRPTGTSGLPHTAIPC